MTEDSGPSQPPETQGDAANVKPSENNGDSLSSQRVFKKSSLNARITLYLSSRDLVVSNGKIDRLQGVILVDPEFVENRKIYGQITLTFRYGREDEEVMGLKFCNEAIMCVAQLYPPLPNSQPEGNTPLQDALLKRLGPNAYPFSMEITHLAPPSVQLVPAKEYNGAAIGTSYDVRAYMAEKEDEKFHKRATVRMGIRVVQRAFAPPSPYQYVPGGLQKTNRDRAKEHRKALLGGGLEVKFASRESPRVSPSEEEEDQEEKEVAQEDDRLMQKEQMNQDPEQRTKREHSPDHPRHNVTFKHLTNGGRQQDLLDPECSEKPPDDREKDVSPTQNLQQGDCDLTQMVEEHENPLLHYRSICGSKRPSLAAYLAGVPAPRAAVEKPFLLSEGRVHLTASLNKGIYSHGEEICVNVHVRNGSSKTVRRIKVFVVQHVDVCMFSNGKFKNVVAMVNSKDDLPIQPGGVFDKSFTLLPVKSSTKNWIALEDSYTKSGTSLSSTVTCTGDGPEDRNVFAIYVSYYVKVKLVVSVMGGQVNLKLPFTLMHTCSDLDHTENLCRVNGPQDVELELRAPSIPRVVKQEKDGT
ncbi:beta-arrestin-2-like isoform X2 [Harmonia axyridis]|uniref:beta-arrestin-2-like isoform X2 n=1 Tax=Harmonia axyridis TaxID=115357 RepID=UPI001E279703|nr:beta-arrestin-2-like isoform X2 [Harmonia axyridis]